MPLERYRAARLGARTAEEIVREAVLELTYTARDMAPFARAMGIRTVAASSCRRSAGTPTGAAT